MKIIEKISHVIFANLILIISIIIILIMFGWISTNGVQEVIRYVREDAVKVNIVIALCVVLILLAIKCIFFDSDSKEERRMADGIVLANDNGKLLVSKDTIENLAISVVRGFEGADNTVTKVYIDGENNVKMDVILFVHPDAVIKDLSSNLQMKIKETVKTSLDLEIQEVNVRVKNIAPKKQIQEG